MSGAARGLCDANCHLHGQGDSFHVATCAAEIARDAEREQLAAALAEHDAVWSEKYDERRCACGAPIWDGLDAHRADALLPVVDRIANERAAAALEAAAGDPDCFGPGVSVSTLRARAAALRASNGEAS